MSTRTISIALSIGFVVIVTLAIALFLIPSPAVAPGPDKSSTSVSDSESPAPFSSENVKVSTPLPGAEVGKTFKIVGEARGDWYFEAVFPIQAHDSANNRVGGGTAKAQSDWMTSEFVPFSGEITIDNYSGPATLALLKNNPSRLPENDDAVSIPIIIK